ncbi:S-adenosyl-L-methionine-dependent methyltransferase [Phlyctochytrium arcticum]|nr:S-adenosyl-L-methionine-dependent methyltransferase [Phlyctochytrium arcticum]
MKHIDAKLPPVINRYFEPFVGGGSVLFHVAEKYQMNIKQYFINDKDDDLINLYLSIKEDAKELLLSPFAKDKGSFIKYVEIFNNDVELNTIKRSALYLYLLKLSFNNNLKHKNGRIHPTYSARNAAAKKIYNPDHIEGIAPFLQQVNIFNLDYILFIKRFSFEKNDFVFLDPPYNVASVNEYYSSTFQEKNYNELLALCDDLHQAGVNWMLTLDSSEIHKRRFAKYNIHEYDRHSFISNGRNKDKEIIITNY